MVRRDLTHRRWLATLSGSIIIAALFAWLPLEASAADLRQGSDVTVARTETVNDDIYAGAGTINIGGTVNGNVIAGGGTITVSGNITRDLIVGGGTINVTGHVGGSIIAAGGNLTLSGNGLGANTLNVTEVSPADTFHFTTYIVDQNRIFVVCTDTNRVLSGTLTRQP